MDYPRGPKQWVFGQHDACFLWICWAELIYLSYLRVLSAIGPGLSINNKVCSSDFLWLIPGPEANHPGYSVPEANNQGKCCNPEVIHSKPRVEVTSTACVSFTEGKDFYRLFMKLP